MKKDIEDTGKKIFCSVLSVSSVAICLLLFFYSGVFASDDSGTFRGKWWNYYDRALSSVQRSDWESSLKDLKKVISLRSKDQRMARTYGMHFTDYFPHRELGIVYYNMGDTEKAGSELQESIRSEESAKAVYYLNKVKKAGLLKQKDKSINPPGITVESPSEGAALNMLAIRLKGKASGNGFISGILINNAPYRFEMAKEEIPFEEDIALDDGENRIVVKAEDLLGNKSEKTVTVIVDREGPAVSLSGIRNEIREGKNYVRITGEVSDGTGIGRVLVNGKAEGTVPDLRTKQSGVPLYRAGVESGLSPTFAKGKSYEFDVSLERNSAKKVTIQAFDTLDNETTAEVDIEKELTAFNGSKRYVLLAFNGGKIFSFDKEQPVLDLKDSEDPPEVFVDKYFIDGQAYDNNKISRILVNGKEISAGRGKKVYFSKMIKLNEGKNRIIVDVYDSADNKATAVFTVNRAVPSVMQTASRMSISVLPIDGRQAGPDITRLAYERLIDAFVEQKRFSVIERAKLEQILMEHKLAKEKLTDPEHSIKVGKLMSADSILSTSIREDKKSIEIISRIINTETSEIMEVKDVFAEDKSLLSVKELIDGLASKIARSFPVVEGMIIKNDKKEAYSDIGGSAKIKKNTGVIIYRKGKEIKHPVTGKSLGHDTVKLGEGYIEEIHEGFSKIRLSDKHKNQEINVKDLIVTK